MTLAAATELRRAARAAATAVSLGAIAALVGCGPARDMTMQFLEVPELPESADVDDAPWPRLVDSPAPVATELGVANNFQSQVARGEAIDADVQSGATALTAQSAALTGGPAEGAALDRDVNALRREVDALRASEVD